MQREIHRENLVSARELTRGQNFLTTETDVQNLMASESEAGFFPSSPPAGLILGYPWPLHRISASQGISRENPFYLFSKEVIKICRGSQELFPKAAMETSPLRPLPPPSWSRWKAMRTILIFCEKGGGEGGRSTRECPPSPTSPSEALLTTCQSFPTMCVFVSTVLEIFLPSVSPFLFACLEAKGKLTSRKV